MKPIEPNNTADDVVRPFYDLMKQIEEKHKKKLVYKWIREVFEPRVRKWEEADPVLFAAGAYMSGLRSINGGHYLYIEGDAYNLSANKAWPRSIPSDLVTMKELVEGCQDETIKAEMGQAQMLKEKAQTLHAMLKEFLEGFTSMEQAIFSLPELKSFAPQKVTSQKRPRYFKVPSNDLRRLMMEAARLKEALEVKNA